MVKIRMWSWEEAPENYKTMSDHGGDEDIVIELTGRLSGWKTPSWLEKLMDEDTYIDDFGHMSYFYEYEKLIAIGAHA